MKKGKIDIVPAILVKSRAEFEARLALVAPFVSRVQIDIMDGKFVPNRTLQPEEFPPLPANLEAEYHLMVENPLDYVRKIGKKGAIYEIHVESVKDVGAAIVEIKKLGGKVALVISPDTPASAVEPYLSKIEHVLVMTVYPGFSGQKYLPSMEEKMHRLSALGAIVEVDGGIDIGTARSAARAGATFLGVASGIFAKPDMKKAIEEMKKDAEG